MNIPRRHFISALTLAAMRLSLYGQDVPLPLRRNSVRFAAIGDMGTGNRQQYEIADRMNSAHDTFHFDFVTMLGDNIYGGNAPSDYAKKFELPYKRLLDSGVQFYGSLGNHDSPTERFYTPFNMAGERYYTYIKGNVQFFVLDTTYLTPEQLAWIEKELRNSKADWKICYFHHPLYSSGDFHGPSIEMRLLLEPLFLKYGVQVVLSGHEHVYERTLPQKGIHYFIEGASGELRKGNLKKIGLTAVGYDQDRSFLLVEVSGDELNFQAISRTGKVVDSGLIVRGAKSKDAVSAILSAPGVR